MRTLVVYYSYSGTTRKLAEALAKALGADVAEIRCASYGRGAVDFLKACYDSVMGRLPGIETTQAMPQSYDLVVVGGPVWAGHVATPVRAFLNGRRGQFKSIAFFLTAGGSPTDAALKEMGDIAQIAPVATLGLKTAEVHGATCAAAVDGFAKALTVKAAA